jgi:hypothetical protein
MLNLFAEKLITKVEGFNSLYFGASGNLLSMGGLGTQNIVKTEGDEGSQFQVE